MIAIPLPHLPSGLPGRLRRGALAGAAWGLVTAGGLVAWNLASCDVVCLDVIAGQIALGLGLGVAMFAPVVALFTRETAT